MDVFPLARLPEYDENQNLYLKLLLEFMGRKKNIAV